jgi:predicted Zn-dependent protease
MTAPVAITLLVSVAGPTISPAYDAPSIGLVDRAIQDVAAARERSADDTFADGMREYERDNYGAAAAAFTKVTELKPSDGTAWAMRGLCEFRLGHHDAALTNIQKGRALGTSGDAQFLNVLRYHEGVLLSAKGEFERAQEVLATVAASTDSDEAIVALGLAVLRVPAGDRGDHALPGRTSSSITERASAARQAGLAERDAARKEPDAALRAYEALSKGYPTVRNTAYALGRHFLARREPDRAVVAFLVEIERFADHVPARLGVAAAKASSDPAVALRFAEDAVRLNPRVPLGHFLLGSLLLETPDTGRAIAELELAEQSVKEDPRVYYALGRAYARAGRTADAERARATFRRLTDDQQRRARGER